MSELQQGYTTGSCAAAATKAAVQLLCYGRASTTAEIPLPDGERLELPIVCVARKGDGATAAVRKDGGDDPDITHGMLVWSTVQWTKANEVQFVAGEGVGVVTLPGLSVASGEPAINPGPRAMIVNALREVTERCVRVEIAIPGGRELAVKTFNPKLGILGGLSILGTTGRVRAFSHEAMRTALLCGMDVAAASGERAPVFVPGNIGEKAARHHLRVSKTQVVDVGNEWGLLLDRARKYGVERLLAFGHPGKLGKLWLGQWDTHSSRSTAAVKPLADLAARLLGKPTPQSPTVEGILMGVEEHERRFLADEFSQRIQAKVAERMHGTAQVAVVLVNMAGDWLGDAGDLSAWR